MPGGWVYIMTNHPNGTLYIGVTSDLPAASGNTATAFGSKFAHRYYLKRLVYAEPHDEIAERDPAGDQPEALAASMESGTHHEAQPGLEGSQ